MPTSTGWPGRNTFSTSWSARNALSAMAKAEGGALGKAKVPPFSTQVPLGPMTSTKHAMRSWDS